MWGQSARIANFTPLALKTAEIESYVNQPFVPNLTPVIL